MEFLKQAIEQAFGPKTTLINVVKSNVGGMYKARSHAKVHASDLTKDDFCPRQTALLDLTKTEKKNEFIATAMKMTYDVGHAVSDLARENWFGQQVYGNWECLHCGKIWSFQTRPKACVCGIGEAGRWGYREVEFVSTTYQVSGSLDAIVDLGAPRLSAVEIKIMAVDQFDKLVAPLQEHRIRTSLYLKIIEDSNSIYRNRLDVSQGRVLYFSRGHGKKNEDYGGEILPMKEYVVKRDDEPLVPLLEKATAVKDWREKKIIPAGVCPTSFVPAAKKCSVCAICFGGKYPAASALKS